MMGLSVDGLNCEGFRKLPSGVLIFLQGDNGALPTKACKCFGRVVILLSYCGVCVDQINLDVKLFCKRCFCIHLKSEWVPGLFRGSCGPYFRDFCDFCDLNVGLRGIFGYVSWWLLMFVVLYGFCDGAM